MTTPSTAATLPENAPPGDAPQSLLGMEREELAAVAAEIGEPAFRGKQLFQWVYNRGVRDFEAMTNLARPLRARLAERFRLDRPEVGSRHVSTDGTRKWLLRFADGNEAECVYIPEPDRGTLCISSQVGCSLTCTFCHTGTQRMVRNLTPGELVGQILLARDDLEDWGKGTENRRITNIVLMGMGEPLYNTDNVIKAMRIASDGDGLAISRRRITLSTSGVVPEIARAGEALGVGLAISLHAVTDDLRNVLVPINRKYPLDTLLAAVRSYPGLSNARRVTWEYVMLKDVNDSPADAKRLVELIRGIPSKINLIPFNPWPGAPYDCSDEATIARFAAVVEKAGYMSPVRTPRGRDIMAACGQLKSASERQRKIRTAATTT